MSKYGVISGSYFPVFGLNIWRFTLYISVFSPITGKHGPEITPHLDTFHAVIILMTLTSCCCFLTNGSIVS